jgi:hypothetical protein
VYPSFERACESEVVELERVTANAFQQSKVKARTAGGLLKFRGLRLTFEFGGGKLGAVMDKKRFEYLVRLVTSKEKDERVLSRDTSRGDVSMWGKIAVDEAGGKVGDWLVGSWSVADGAPPWVPRVHYYCREERKFYRVQLNIDTEKMGLSVEQEDRDIDSERAKYIVENLDSWEREPRAVASSYRLK